ncbi:hypothetical protein [Pseudoalteromonas rubra]|uniref:hypothetical protein n=1 Tax=Pseudoalteromonas rubra TaxID=43658 RepID=UPI001109F560|nr:hypothetical protein [Pseudoalteromonas rubra]
MNLRFWADCQAQCDNRRFQRQMVRDFELAMPRVQFTTRNKDQLLSCQDGERCTSKSQSIAKTLEIDVTLEELERYDLRVFDLVVIGSTSESGAVIPQSVCNLDAICTPNDNFHFTTLSPGVFSVTYQVNKQDADELDDEQKLREFTQKANYQCTEQTKTMASHVQVTLTCEHLGEQRRGLSVLAASNSSRWHREYRHAAARLPVRQ